MGDVKSVSRESRVNLLAWVNQNREAIKIITFAEVQFLSGMIEFTVYYYEN